MSHDLPRWVIVVRRDRREFYESLRLLFEADGRVEVVLDRRTGARRGENWPVGTERRRSSRRRAPMPEQAALWEDAGFRMIHRDEGYDVYQAEAADAESGPEAERKTERDQRLRATLWAARELLEDRQSARDQALQRLLAEALRLLDGRTP